MFKPVFDLLSPAGERGRLSTLIFHRVLRQRDPLFPGEVTQADFDAICRWVKAWFNVLPLDVAVQLLREGRLPSRAMSITFDDGYADNHDVALPVLQRHGLTASFFVATGFLDGGRMWNDTVIEAIRGCRLDRVDLHGTPAATLGVLSLEGVPAQRDAIDRIIGATKYLAPDERNQWVQAVADRTAAMLPEDLMMCSKQVRALHLAGMCVGAHTVSHPILAGLSTAEIQREIREGRSQLQDITQATVVTFAYPNGRPGTDYDDRAVQVVREEGFTVAVSTRWGTAKRQSDMLQLPRFTPWDRTRVRFGLRLAGQLLNG
jgi:peptidoglycan/xylan/chitin deacetylase (PgdA/CDA1 family)